MNYTIDELKKEYSMLDIETTDDFTKEAIKKLQAEKCEHALDLIRMLLVLTLSHGDSQLAESIINSKYKSIENCFKHVKKWAKEKATAGCAVIDHEEVMSEAIHYYVDMEDKEEKSPSKNITIPNQAQRTPSLFDSSNEAAASATSAQTPKTDKAFAYSNKPKEEPAKKQADNQNNLISLF